MINDFFLGISTFFKSIRFVNKNGLAHFYIYPILFSGLLFWISAKGKDRFLAFLDEVLFTTWGLENYLEKGSTGEGIIDGILYWFFSILVWILILIINRYIVLIFLSPLFAYLSEKVEAKLNGKDYPFSLKQTLKDALRGAFIAVKNLVIEIFIILFCVALKFFFPPVSIITVPIMWLTAWYFMGFSFIDYNHERQRLSSRQSSKRVWNRKGLAIGNGMLFTIIAYIPILGVTFGSVWSTVGATLAIHKETAKSIKRGVNG